MDSIFDSPVFRRESTLLEYTTRIKRVLASDRELMNCWVAAELSDVQLRGGHCYLELIQKNERGTTVAKMRATIWANYHSGIAAKFFAATNRALASGLKVMLRGSASFHEVFGLSFNVTDIDPTYTMGDMERIRREILAALQREGVLNRNKELPWPVAPQCVAVVSAPGAAGYGDFCNQLHSSAEGFVFYDHLFPAVMQGERTAASVMAALDRIEMSIDRWDCVVIIRGGGSTSDLNGFDDLELARRVAGFSIPVIVGIGHERDRTVLDEIAHTRVKTPTAAAELLLSSLRDAAARAEELFQSVVRYGSERLEGSSRQLAQLEALIPALGRQRIAEARTLLQKVAAAIPAIASGRIDREEQRLSFVMRDLQRGAEVRLRTEAQRLDHLEAMASALSPVATLRRGYSITRIGGKAVRSADGVSRGTRLTTTLFEGTLESETI